VKKVLLVNTNTYATPYPVPPLGLCLAAASLDGQYDVRIYDGLRRQTADLERTVQDFAPDYVGVGIRNIDDASLTSARYFVDAVQRDFVAPIRRLTRAPVILGGSGFSLFPVELMALLGAEYGIVGDAENALPALLAALDAGQDGAQIPGVMCARRLDAPVAPNHLADLSRLPFSDMAARLDYGPYTAGAYSIQTKRGCRHDCLYCSYPSLEGHALRQRPVSGVVDEIEQAQRKLGDVMFEFVDAVLNDPPGRLEAICREVIRRGLRARFRTMGINPAHVTGELLSLMRQAGFVQIDATPDSASAEMLRRLRKNFTLDELQNAARLIREHDMPTMWFFLLGGPGECEQTVAETVRFIDEFVGEEDMIYITIGLRIYPLTELHRMAISEGVVAEGESLLQPRFYVSPQIGARRLTDLVREAASARPNCFAAGETTPPPELREAAIRLRAQHNLKEPMFRTLLRVRRETWKT
jgi:radical SAM superfamily enzyme YgiQ (UPF0313 family)